MVGLKATPYMQMLVKKHKHTIEKILERRLTSSWKCTLYDSTKRHPDYRLLIVDATMQYEVKILDDRVLSGEILDYSYIMYPEVL